MSNPHPRAPTDPRLSSLSGSYSANDGRPSSDYKSIDGRGIDQSGWGQLPHWPNDPRGGKRPKPSSGAGVPGSNAINPLAHSHQSSSSSGRGSSHYSRGHPQGPGGPHYQGGGLPPWPPTAPPPNGSSSQGMNFHHGPTDLPPRPYGAGESLAPPKPRGKIPGSAMEFLPILEQRVDALEGAVEGYAKLRAQQALDRSKIKGLDTDQGRSKKK